MESCQDSVRGKKKKEKRKKRCEYLHNYNKNNVTTTDQTYNGTLCIVIPGTLILEIFVMKLIELSLYQI